MVVAAVVLILELQEMLLMAQVQVVAAEMAMMQQHQLVVAGAERRTM